ncbi:MAG: biotin/lipoyl-binding protein, partial [Planctomycetota bacterium]
MPRSHPLRPSSNAPATTSSSLGGLRRRPELIATWTYHRTESAVVVKDPVALTYHRMRPDEYFVLQCLDRCDSLEELCAAYEERFPETRVKTTEINDLVLHFHRLGLTISALPEQGSRLHEKWLREKNRRWKSQLSSVLFIRFPGVDPEPFLRRVYPCVRPLFHPIGFVLGGLVVAAGITILCSQWDRFTHEFPTLHQWMSLRAVVCLGVTIGSVKILHELGHAFVCKHFGGECHQIGPMLLVFTPALYCDTSDSWMLPDRYARASVGAAGMVTELLLASIATVVWASTGHSLVHYLAMNVMLVCSVSTVLFNANPLLRYDGYYILSDLCDVPNLGQKAQRSLRALLSRVLLGIPQAADARPSGNRFWLLSYAILAGVYRWALTAFILFWLLWMLRPYRLESIGRMLCLIAFSGLAVTSIQPVFQLLRHPGKRRQVKMARLAITASIFLAMLVASLIPLPSGESSVGKLTPRVETPIYVTTGGLLDRILVKTGEQVKQGQELAVLTNADVDLQLNQAASRVESQRVLVEALEASRIESLTSANELPAARTLLSELERQLDSRRARKDALRIKAPAAGTLVDAPTLEVAPSNEVSLANWSGRPTDQRNQGCRLDSGTEIFA